MEEACRGAKSQKGVTVGILPGTDRSQANPYLDIALPTGLFEGRNFLLVRTANAAIAIGGSWGTLSEIALAVKTGLPVVGLKTLEITKGGKPLPGPVAAKTPEEAVNLALSFIRKKRS